MHSKQNDLVEILEQFYVNNYGARLRGFHSLSTDNKIYVFREYRRAKNFAKESVSILELLEFRENSFSMLILRSLTVTLRKS